jgi:hypothetical protein
MLLRRWAEHNRRRREQRIAQNAEAWLEALGLLLEASRSLLRPQRLPTDLITALHRIDWWLEHLVQAERVLRRALREPDLNARVRRTTELAFRLRNEMVSYFIRWKAFQDSEQTGVATAFLDRREMEEALLAARQTSRDLAAQVDQAKPILPRAIAGGPQAS